MSLKLRLLRHVAAGGGTTSRRPELVEPLVRRMASELRDREKELSMEL